VRCAFAQSDNGPGWHEILRWCAFTSILLLSLTVKRENILLIIVLPLIAVLAHLRDRHASRSYSWSFLAGCRECGGRPHLELSHGDVANDEQRDCAPPQISSYGRRISTACDSVRTIILYRSMVYGVRHSSTHWGHRCLAPQGPQFLPLVLFVAFVLLYGIPYSKLLRDEFGPATDPRAPRFVSR